MVSFGVMDLVLVLVVSVQGTALAYLRHPKWKAFLLSLPIPFTLSTLAVGRPMDATNAVGTLVLLGYTHLVRVLYQNARLPIIPAIALSAAGYCLAGSALAGILPTGDIAFWISCAAILPLGLAMLLLTPPREEAEHKSPLPVWIKLPAIAAVLVVLVLIKQHLHGFTTMFPMVGVVAAYEGRRSLWTICRQIPVIMVTTLPLMAVVKLTQPHVGLAWGLAIGWVVFLCILIPLTRWMWASDSRVLSTGVRAADGALR